ncbi:MAG: hypothetical protein RLZ12_828 [Bacillota bacterium]|jgi:hypothetical protein
MNPTVLDSSTGYFTLEPGDSIPILRCCSVNDCAHCFNPTYDFKISYAVVRITNTCSFPKTCFVVFYRLGVPIELSCSIKQGLIPVTYQNAITITLTQPFNEIKLFHLLDHSKTADPITGSYSFDLGLCPV